MPMWRFDITPGVGFVPASYNFSHVIGWLLDFRESRPEGGIPNFQQWLINEHGYAPGAAAAYCYPLQHWDCNLNSLSVEHIRTLAERPGSAEARNWLRGFRHVKDLDQVPNSIVCAYLVCECIRKGIVVGNARAANFVERGHAGTPYAGRAMNTVGLSIARHFGLVDETQPQSPTVTSVFDKVFGV